MSSQTEVRIDVSPGASHQLVSLDCGPLRGSFFIGDDVTVEDVNAVLEDLSLELEYAARIHPDAGVVSSLVFE